MKKASFLSLLFITGAFFNVNAQNNLNPTGNVGIGTGTSVVPTEPLSVASSNAYTLSLLRTATGGNISTVGTTAGGIYFGSYATGSGPRYEGALIRLRTTEPWDVLTARGAALGFETVANGTTTLAERMRIDNNGNVGIGTTTPAIRLHVAAYNATIQQRFERTGSSTGIADIGTNSGDFFIYPGGYSNAKPTVFTTEGKIGVGTTDPVSKLQVNGSGTLGGLYDASKAAFRISMGGNMIMDGNEIFSDGSLSLGIAPAGNFLIGTVDATTPFAAAFRVTGAGNVGIGTTSPTQKLHVSGNMLATGQVLIGTISNPGDLSDYKLAVNGTALFTKAVVRAYANWWPDYVFEKGYNLMPLNKVEAFILQNKHLPGVPSAQDVNNSGVDLGDTQAVLLKKIEELTLYIIDQDKVISQLKTDLKNKEGQDAAILSIRKLLEQQQQQLDELKGNKR
ncbi:hypothetical protein [Foetidibacter luteolus]|uniref:hypothetical protein n=1 Tax=Foetidibacter luteolus TaxID=2608880 RepID=UPI00129A847C|nr:hypothetical protein [Foetidibacter luteolus]